MSYHFAHGEQEVNVWVLEQRFRVGSIEDSVEPHILLIFATLPLK